MSEFTIDDVRASVDRLKLPGFVQVQVAEDRGHPVLRLIFLWDARGLPKQREAATTFSLKPITSAPHLEWWIQRQISSLWATILWTYIDQPILPGISVAVVREPEEMYP